MNTGKERKNSEARIAANNRYAAKAYDRINLAVKKGRKADIEARAASLGKSTNKYINELIDADLKEAGE